MLKRNRILSSAPDKVAAKLAPKYAGPHSFAARLGSYVYEVVDESNIDAGKLHVVDLKPYHGEREPDPDDSIDEAPTDAGEAPPPVGIATPPTAGKKRDTVAVAATKPKGKRGRPRKTRVFVTREKRVE